MRPCFLSPLFTSLGILATACCWAVPPTDNPESPIAFNDDVRPILSKHCIACHGPDEGDRQADLRLDTQDGAHEWAIIPGEADDSDVMARIMTDDPDTRMPPPEHGEPLSAAEISTLKTWINQGATYEKHWSFQLPRQSDLATLKKQIHDADPEIASWAKTPIDTFIAQRWIPKSLRPADEESSYRMARRVSLALTGLPPSGHRETARKIIDRFASDPSDGNYESMVDALLASPSYGEHWAAGWLDLARYADTVGYSGDEDRSIWPWRDWVIRSLNQNMPFDQFTIEQLAGDLLPDASANQKLATAFHRNTLSNNEGGTDNEEFRTIAVKDRINTTVNVWMGLTMRCAECHSHKYDPISQTEYYQFLDFFNQSVDNDQPDERPRLETYPAGRETEFAKLRAEIETLTRQRTEQGVWKPLKPTEAVSRDGTTFEILDDDSVLATGPNPEFDEYRLTFELPAGTHSGLRLEVIPDERNGGNSGRSADGGFIITQVRAEIVGSNPQSITFNDVQADHEHVNLKAKYIIRKKTDDKGWSVNHPQDGYRAKREVILSFEKSVQLETPSKLSFVILHEPQWKHLNSGRVRLSTTEVDAPAMKYRKKNLDPIGRKIAELEKKLQSPIRVPVMQDRDAGQRRETFVNLRGNYKSHGDRVTASVPAAFHRLPEGAEPGATPNRLSVARWLVAQDNPLTARVTVNRFWARLFGIGLVETEEDFGTQGMPPSHPELLDHLAIEFVQSGWDVKALLKRIVMSSTYRQSNAANETQKNADPRNRLLARGPRFRLTAEEVRDQTLAATGLLSHKMYGPPVYPSNPIKKTTNAFKGDVLWKVSDGEDQYRRALYTYLKRSQPHPMFGTFDMETREVCSLRRFRTNTPLQSLMNLNSESSMEAAQALARQVLESQDSTDFSARDAVRRCVQAALYGPPIESQVQTLVTLFESANREYQADHESAAAIAGQTASSNPVSDVDADSVAAFAAMTVVANVVLNLDQFVTN